jgi:outer membrane protein assembly factor BamB
MVPVLSAHRGRFLAFFGVLAVGLFAGGAASAKGPRPLWSFHAGAPLSGAPGVGADGSLAVGTLDGYVHALRSDGVFRYSYTVQGRVLGSPVVLADGLVLVASDRSRVVAIRSDGSFAWETYIAGGVQSALAVDAQERVWLRTGAGTALALSRRGGVVGFAKLARGVTLGPAPLTPGGVLVASPEGELRLIGDFGKSTRNSISGPLTNVLASASGPLLFGPGTLRALSAELAVAWTHSGVEELLCATPIVARAAGEVRWLSDVGSVQVRVAAHGLVTGPSACSGSSLFAVDARGGIVQVRSNGDVIRVDGPGGALVGLAPIRPGSLVAAYQDGRVIALKVVF